MTIQEVATMVKTGVCPYLFVINNDGWVADVGLTCGRMADCVAPCVLVVTPLLNHSLALPPCPRSLRSPAPASYEIERQIHGVKAKYNNIQMIDHQMMLPFFVGKSVRRRRGRSGIHG